jgi:hypothetical protein
MSDNKAESVSLEDFIAAATRGVLRALAESSSGSPGSGVTPALNPQPLPPREDLARLVGGGIFIGIAPMPRETPG